MNKGVYIVSEAACLNEHTGARKHIDVGVAELNKAFDMDLLLFCNPEASVFKKLKGQKPAVKRSRFYMFFKWFYILIRSHISFLKYFRLVKKLQPEIIYERAAYLNYSGLIISKLLRIPHVYEVNGILADDNAQYYPSVCSLISRALEKLSYKNTFGFYVGGINQELNIGREKSEIIQNGIDQEFVSHFKERKVDTNGLLNIVFVGHAMQHHRLDILAECLKLTKKPESFRLHLIGNHLEFLETVVPSQVKVVQHGALSQEKIENLIDKMHISVLPFAKDYYSHVKVFMYGAAKLAVILPRSRNYSEIFTNDEVVFANNLDPIDLARKLDVLEANRTLIQSYGENLYNKVSTQFTWNRIYENVAATINSKVLKVGITPAVSQ